MKKSEFRSLFPVLTIFCLALLVRVIYNLTVARFYTPHNDSAAYQAIAFHLLDGHCYCWNPHVTTASRTPFWPLLIAGISLIVGRANIYDRLFLCLADAGTCVLVYLFARQLFQKRIGLIAGLIACIYPALYIYTGWMYTETLYTFLLTAICYCIFLIQRAEGQRRPLSILCGVLLALLVLTRPNGMAVVGLVVCWAALLVWRKHLHMHIFKYVALMTLIACTLIAPWSFRNYLASHSLVPLAVGDGTVLLGSYNDQSIANKGMWVRLSAEVQTCYSRLHSRVRGCAGEPQERDCYSVDRGASQDCPSFTSLSSQKLLHTI